MYHDVARAAFEVLREELDRTTGRKDPRVRRAARALNLLERRYRAQRYSGAQLGAVRVRPETWSTDEKEAVLHQVARVIRDGELAQATYGNAQLLRGLWERGHLPEVERLCTELQRAMAQGHTDEVKWLLATWTPRRASNIASAATSQRLDRGRRARSKENAKPRTRGPAKTPTRVIVPRRGA